MEGCPVGYALSFLEGKWKLRVIYAIGLNDNIRFNELRRQVGSISNLMLSKTLQELEDGGIITRRQYNEVPPRVEYSLTELGKGIYPVMDSLEKWGESLYLHIENQMGAEKTMQKEMASNSKSS